MNHQLSAWNERWNGLPRKALLIAVTFLLAAALLWTLPYVWPFAVALVLSTILEPFVRFASKGLLRFSERKRRIIGTLAGMALLFGLAGAALAALVGWLFRELTGFVRSLPQLLQWFNDRALPEVIGLYRRFSILLPDKIPDFVEQNLVSFGQSLVRSAASLSAWLTGGAWSTAASIPHALLSLVLTLMGTYYMTADRKRISAFFRRILPADITNRSRLIRASLLKALMGQLRSQLTISLIVMFFLMIALGISGIRYGTVIGMLIGLADALPLFGAGVFLIPWSLVSFLTGQTGLGITLACLYGGAIVIRQILEPKLIGRQLGLYPLAAMAAMYAGYRLLGFAGLLAGPVLLTLAKAVLDADKAVTQAPP